MTTNDKQMTKRIDLDVDNGVSERLSLYNVLENKNNAANRKTILHRIVLVSKLRTTFTNKAQIGEYYEKMFKEQNQQQTDAPNPNPFLQKVTGLAIIYPTLMIHVIESSTQTINHILTELEMMHNDTNSMISHTKILNIGHETHIRLFPFYTYKLMNLTLENDSSSDAPSDTVENLVGDILTRLMRFGKFLFDQSSQIKKDIVDTTFERHPEFLPNQNYANSLLKSEDLLTPRELLDFYQKPFNMTFESELTWPTPSKLFPYH